MMCWKKISGVPNIYSMIVSTIEINILDVNVFQIYFINKFNDKTVLLILDYKIDLNRNIKNVTY